MSAIAILDGDSNLLIHRAFSNEFIPIKDIILEFQSIDHTSPILQLNGINYLYIKNNEIYLLIISYYDHINVMSLFTFLYKFNDILMNYFKVTILSKDLIIDNFNLIYELFDEIIDFGIPQLTDFTILNDVIKLEVNHSEEDNSSVLRSTTSSISWRPKGIFYKKNEFFVDVVEKICLIVGTDLKIVKYEIHGEINVKCYLSGMPLLKIGLNKLKNEQFLSNLTFNQCVELEKFTNEHVIEFIPPDGQFILASYNLSIKSLPIIQIKEHNFQIKDDKLIVKMIIKTNFKMSSTMNDLIIKIPVSGDYNIDYSQIPKFKCKIGKVLFKFDENSIVWKIDTVNGDREFLMMSQFQLLKTNNNEDNDDSTNEKKEELGMDPPPISKTPKFDKIKEIVEITHINKDISIEFELPDLTLSQLKIDYLKINEPQLNYTSFPWVRYKTINSEDYIYRL